MPDSPDNPEVSSVDTPAAQALDGDAVEEAAGETVEKTIDKTTDEATDKATDEAVDESVESSWPEDISAVAVLEALLFATDEPVTAAKLAGIIGAGGVGEVKKTLQGSTVNTNKWDARFV